VNEVVSLMENNFKFVVEDFQGHKFFHEIVVVVMLRLILLCGIREKARRKKKIIEQKLF